MKLSTQRSISILASILLILVSLWFAFSIDWPVIEKALILHQTLKAQEERYNTQKERLDIAKSLIETYRASPQLAELISSALPLRQETPEIIAQLATIAAQNNVIIGSMSFSEAGIRPGAKKRRETLQKGYATITVQMELTARYQNFRNWLRMLENNIRLMDVKQITVSGSAPGAKEKEGIPRDLLTFSVILETYYQL